MSQQQVQSRLMIYVDFYQTNSRSSIYLRLRCLLVLLGLCSFVTLEVRANCTVNGRSISVGDTWQPSSSTVPCYHCWCSEFHRIRCSVDCQALTVNRRTPRLGYPTPDILTPGAPTKRLRNRSPETSTSFALNSCLLDSNRHQHGSTWKEIGPHAQNLAANQCMECSCSSSVVTCVIRQCPAVTCRNPIRLEQTCCFTCPDQYLIRPQRNSHKAVGCTSISRHFPDGARWRLYLPSANVVTACFTCVCLGTKDRCQKHSCPPVRCASSIRRPGQCCPECQAPDASSQPGSSPDVVLKEGLARTSFPALVEGTRSGLPFIFPQEPAHEGATIADAEPVSSSVKRAEDCVFGGMVYAHNSTFHPVLKPFGLQICTRCFCTNEAVKCGRINCPTRYPCQRPVHREHSCCKVCPGMTQQQVADLGRLELYKSRDCPRAKRSQIHVYKYKREDSLDSSRFALKYLFERPNPPNAISQRHEWELVGTIANVHRTQLSREQVLACVEVQRGKMEYIGSIKERVFTKLLADESTWQRCQSRCLQKMLHMASTLANRAARRKQQCPDTDRQTAIGLQAGPTKRTDAEEEC